MLDIKTEKNENGITLKLCGSINSAVADLFSQQMNEALSAEPVLLTLDFENVDIISSAGIRTLFMAGKIQKANNRRFIGININSNVEYLLNMVKVGVIMEINPTDKA